MTNIGHAVSGTQHQKGLQLENGKIIAGGYVEAESNQNIGEELFVEKVREYVEEHLKEFKSSHRSIEECIQLFNELSEQAFTKRVGAGIPGLRLLVEAHHHSQIRSSGLKNAFKTALGERRMFGDGETSPANVGNKEIKVGVILTASSGYPYLVTSYNREDFKNTGGDGLFEGVTDTWQGTTLGDHTDIAKGRGAGGVGETHRRCYG
ncbi:hypothetical protein BDZ91DRAFT_852452 [Kalaharituber pfeilii]|nr:hypothetical protein BDZ91DRAFT_852452 [Kalaharituber pfeilii]